MKICCYCFCWWYLTDVSQYFPYPQFNVQRAGELLIVQAKLIRWYVGGYKSIPVNSVRFESLETIMRTWLYVKTYPDLS